MIGPTEADAQDQSLWPIINRDQSPTTMRRINLLSKNPAFTYLHPPNYEPMRIAGYIDHPRLKITIFQQENRYSLKLETALHEQTYKLRKGGAIETTEDVRRLVDAEFLEQIEEEFKHMHRIQRNALSRLAPSDTEDDEFPTII